MKSNNIFLFITVLLLSSCTIMDLEELPTPEPPVSTGKVALITDWTNRTEGIGIPSSYTVEIDNRKLVFSETENWLPELEAGVYTVITYNQSDRININGTIANIETENSIVSGQPDWLFTSISAVEYEAGIDKTAIAMMEQQIRQLSIELTITEGNPESITHVDAILSGIANTLDIETNRVSGSNLHVVPEFSLRENKLTARVRLLGITGRQDFILSLTFSDGSKQIIESELTDAFADFNSEKHTPISITANLSISLPETGFNAAINGWKVKTSDGIAW